MASALFHVLWVIRFPTTLASERRNLSTPEVEGDSAKDHACEQEPAPASPLLRRQPTGDFEQDHRRSQEHQAPDQLSFHVVILLNGSEIELIPLIGMT
jgi:hypothetical protein